MMLDELVRSRLSQRKADGLLRERTCVAQNHDNVLSTQEHHYLDFASNDYLGLRNHPDVLQAWVEGLAQFGSGSGASPLVTGYMKPHQDLESLIANSLAREAALLFSSGFAANQALCRALFVDGGTLISDKFMHASFIDGATSAGGVFKRFKHNDLQHLDSLLSKADTSKPILVATEGVFSMDGDTPEVAQIAELAASYNAWLMVDDAHAIGVLGKTGRGSIEHFSLEQNSLQIVMGTFGKALGTSGAFVAGSKDFVDYLVNFARDYVYSTAMPPAQAFATQKAWQIMLSGELTDALQKNIDYFRGAAEHHAIPLLTSNSAIQLVPIGDPNLTVEIGYGLKKLGIWVGAMRSPTVPVGTDRLRITLRATHTQQDIDAAIDALSLTLKKYHRETAIGINS